MRTYLAVLLFSAVASYLWTPIVQRFAAWIGAVDYPSSRKVHTKPTPRLGGLAIFGGFCAPWSSFYVLNNNIALAFKDYEKLFLVLMGGAAAILALGIYDDLKGANALKKFAVQILVAVAMYYGGFRVTILSNPFGAPIELGWMSCPVSVLWIVGITNAINLLDGIDGLVSGVTACIALYLALINILTGNIIVALFTLCLAGACLGFLPYNFAPARIFLGDTGSMFIGFTLACIAMHSFFKGTTATLVIVPIVLFGLPLFDTTSVILGRLHRHQPLFEADKTHVHHRLLLMGLNHRQAACTLYAITIFLGGLALVLNWKDAPGNLLLGFAFVLVMALAFVTWSAWKKHIRKELDEHEPARNRASAEENTLACPETRRGRSTVV